MINTNSVVKNILGVLPKSDKKSKNKVRMVRCQTCYNLYPSILEDDYSDRCNDCDEKDLIRTIDNKIVKSGSGNR